MRKHVLPILFLVFLWGIIVFTNYHSGTWLTGWDNLHPEFNFSLNITRSFFGVWQEYQGLGLLPGMSFIATLPKDILLWILSFFIKPENLRYLWTFIMLLLGPIGVYIFIAHITQKIHPEKNTAIICAAMIGGLYYLFNFATVQIFTAPFEPFVMHFAFVPWLLWSTKLLFEKITRKRIMFFLLINILGSTQANIPTLFLVSVILFALTCIHEILMQKSLLSCKKSILLAFLVFCTNAYWLLPFLYYIPTGSHTVVESKINEMATEDIFQKNQAFGTIQDSLALRNFWFDTTEYFPKNGTIDTILSPWIEHDKKPLIKESEFIVAFLIVCGFALSFRKKNTLLLSVIGIIGFTMIANNTEPFSSIVTWLRNTVPLLSQFFRFPFTKWATTLAFSYSLAIGICTFYILSIIHVHRIKYASIFMAAILTVPILLISWPMAQGFLISPIVSNTIPTEYFQLFTYLHDQPQGRVAYLPNSNFWDWKYYQWGSLGSGFLWYGLKQPVLDNAFNSWNASNENYYWEISRALYSKDALALESVLRKYDISYVLLDENMASSGNNRSLFTAETKQLLSEIPGLQKNEQFGKLSLYSHESSRYQSFVTIKSNLPTVFPSYKWTDNDIAYEKFGDYVTTPSGNAQFPDGINPSLTFPFRSLFTKRSVDEREFHIKENEHEISFTDILESTQASILKKDSLVYEAQSPLALDAARSSQCGILRKGVSETRNRKDSDVSYIRFSATHQRSCLSLNIPDLSHAAGYVVAVSSRHIQGSPLIFSIINETAKHIETETHLPTSENDQTQQPWNKSYFILPPLASDGLGYTLYIANDSIGQQQSINDVSSIAIYSLPYKQMTEMMTFSLPKDMSNYSATQSSALNEIAEENFSVTHPNPVFYEIRTDNNAPGFPGNETKSKTQTLILSQSYDSGWKAYLIHTICQSDRGACPWIKTQFDHVQKLFPFFFGTQNTKHVMVNNWENGWVIESSELNSKSTIVLFYLPQILEWIGMIIIPITFMGVFFLMRKRHSDN